MIFWAILTLFEGLEALFTNIVFNWAIFQTYRIATQETERRTKGGRNTRMGSGRDGGGGRRRKGGGKTKIGGGRRRLKVRNNSGSETTTTVTITSREK